MIAEEQPQIRVSTRASSKHEESDDGECEGDDDDKPTSRSDTKKPTKPASKNGIVSIVAGVLPGKITILDTRVGAVCIVRL